MYDNDGWDIAFYVVPMKIPFEERIFLTRVAIEMYLKKERQRKVVRPKYEAVIKTDGKSGLLGCLSGQKFTGVVETSKGKDNIGFLVTSHINHNLN